MPNARLRFADLKKGMRARVVQVTAGGAVVERLLDMGLTPGAEIRVTKVAPLGDPVEIDLRGYRLCLRRQESDAFLLESVD